MAGILMWPYFREPESESLLYICRLSVLCHTFESYTCTSESCSLFACWLYVSEFGDAMWTVTYIPSISISIDKYHTLLVGVAKLRWPSGDCVGH